MVENKYSENWRSVMIHPLIFFTIVFISVKLEMALADRRYFKRMLNPASLYSVDVLDV